MGKRAIAKISSDDLNKFDKEIKTRKRELEKLSCKRDLVGEEVSGLEKKFHVLKNDFGTKESEMESLERRLSSTQKSLQDYEKQLSSKSGEVVQLDTHLERKKSRLS